MADLTFTNAATQRRPQTGIIPGKGDAHSVKLLVTATIELAAASANDTISFGTIPSGARILGQGLIYNDDLATNGSPTLDIGLGSVNSNITNDPDAINTGIALSSSTTTTSVIADLANAGLPAWDLVNGQTSDPGGELEVYGTVIAASTTQTGTITVELYGYLD